MKHITSLFTFSDKTSIPYYEFPVKPTTNKVLLCIHGITSDLEHLFIMAENIRSNVRIDIHIPILRGYTSFEEGKGDIKRKGIYDQDLIEMIDELSKEYEEIYLLGHSMGAGNILRYYLNTPSEKIINIFLVAPFINPSMKVFHDKNDDQSDDLYEIFFKRAVFLGLLDRLKIGFLSHLPVVKIPLREIPYDTSSKTISYTLSFRLMISRFVSNLAIIKRLPIERIHIFIGENDEVIHGKKFKDYWEKEVGNETNLLEELDHNSVLTSEEFTRKMAAIIRHVSN
ncbi:alpha/beta hydrolase [Salipaludibacillus daqingensis]|uniref:alpha/beta hydrolase n=1 Tax=Salipaludibacillus daqingensis TaxID=3041001 RepID=UPI0024755F65|nr:alpha/beta hydrolase [Salipaludibacillus daqingensis]